MSRRKNPNHDHAAGARKRRVTEHWQMKAFSRALSAYFEAHREAIRQECGTSTSSLWGFLQRGADFEGRPFRIPLPRSK